MYLKKKKKRWFNALSLSSCCYVSESKAHALEASVPQSGISDFGYADPASLHLGSLSSFPKCRKFVCIALPPHPLLSPSLLDQLYFFPSRIVWYTLLWFQCARDRRAEKRLSSCTLVACGRRRTAFANPLWVGWVGWVAPSVFGDLWDKATSKRAR